LSAGTRSRTRAVTGISRSSSSAIVCAIGIGHLLTNSTFAAHYTSVITVETDYRRWATTLREIAAKKFHVPPEDAEALVNDVFIAYLLRIEHIRNPEKWLIGAVCHASRGYWRREVRSEPLPRDFPDQPDPGSLDAEEHLVSKLTVALALSHLPERCRRVLRMAYLDGYSHAELGKHLGTTAGYAAQILHDCRRRLRQIYRRLARERTR
jgi:RNA polymerase sigma factor (sigma-70 family)